MIIYITFNLLLIIEEDFEIVFIKIKKEKLNRSFSIIGPRRAGKTYLMYLTIKESIKNIKKITLNDFKILKI
jgi:predicted AAA+ superfamily ATPase